MKVDFYADKTPFQSRIIKISSKYKRPLISRAEREFIDVFEELSTEQKAAYKISEGKTSDIYFVKQFGIVIKAIKTGLDEVVTKFLNGSLKNENDILQELNSTKKTFTQRGIALVDTENGSKFLLSRFVKGKPADAVNNPLNAEKLDSVFDSLLKLDKEHMINFDWNIGNVLIDENNKAVLLDFQWAQKFDHFAKTNIPNVITPPFEVPSNLSTYEVSTISPYIKELVALGGKSEALDFFKTYLSVKSKYNTKLKEYLNIAKYEIAESQLSLAKEKIRFEKLKGIVFQDPSEAVVNAELLKMNTLFNDLRQSYYFAPDLGDNKNIYTAFHHMAQAQNSAKALTEIKIPVFASKEEKEYLQKMREYGKFLSDTLSKKYSETTHNLVSKVMNNDGIVLNSNAPLGDTSDLSFIL